MARSLNRATIIGNLGHDPELRTTPQGVPVCTIRVATTESFKDKTDNWQEQTEWHSVVLWDRLATVAHDYLKKGSKVYVEGKIKTRQYEGKDGITRNVTELIGNNIILLGSKEGGSSSSSYSESNSYSQDFNSPSSSASTMESHLSSDMIDDEVPF